MSIEPIRKVNVSNAVFEQIKEQILNGNWSPGSKIPSENELTQMFGVSRMSVRSALQKLNILGLLESKQGGGTFVSDLSAGMCLNPLLPALVLGKHDLIEIQEFRRSYEIENSRLAARRRSENDLIKLQETLDRMRKYQDDPRRFALEDLNFHLELAVATKNSIILKVGQILKDILHSYMDQIVKFQGTGDALRFHEGLFEAIKNKDSDTAEKFMAEHVELTMNVIEDKYPEE